MVKGISKASVLKGGILIAIFCIVSVFSAKAATESFNVSFSGTSGSSCTATNLAGVLQIQDNGGLNFLGNTACFFGGTTAFSTLSFSQFVAGGGTMGNFFALNPGTYDESGMACNSMAGGGQCNGTPTSPIAFTAIIAGGVLTLSDTAASGGSITVTFNTPTGTPEPSSLILLGSGLLALAGAGIFRKKAGELI